MKYVFPANFSQQSRAEQTQGFVPTEEAAGAVVRDADFKVSCAQCEMGLAISLSTRP